MNDQQKKIAAGAGFALIAALVLYFELRDPNAPAAPPAAVVTTVSAPANAGRPGAPGGAVIPVPGGGPSRVVATSTSAQLDPTLRMGAMLVTESLVYSGSGRNIFSGAPVAPVAMPKPIAPARPKQVAAAPAYVPTGPPPPPPIDLKFFGTATSANGQRRAFLLRGEDVILASAGEIVQRRYKVMTISASSILVMDMANNNQQTLPLLAN